MLLKRSVQMCVRYNRPIKNIRSIPFTLKRYQSTLSQQGKAAPHLSELYTQMTETEPEKYSGMNPLHIMKDHIKG